MIQFCSLINFSVIVSNFVNVLKEYKHIGDLQSSSTLYMAVDKLPQVLKEKWWFYVDDKDEHWPDLIMFEKWLSRMEFVHEGFSAFKGERKEEDRRNTNKEKRFTKTSIFSASSNLQETKQTQSDQCPLADGTHKIWNCPSFKYMSVNDRYVAVRKESLCYGCLGKGMQSKNGRYKWMYQKAQQTATLRKPNERGLSETQRFQRDTNLKELYQQSIDTDVEKGLVKILGKSEVKGTFGKEWYLPHHPVPNPNKPGKIRRV